MIRLLLVEDNQEKAVLVAKHLREKFPSNDIEVTTCSDSHHARRQLGEQYFDVLLLDIQIPQTFDRDPDPIGGITLIKQLSNTTRYNYPAYIIALTAYPESAQLAQLELASHLVHVIEYSPTSDAWKPKLETMISRIISSSISSNSRFRKSSIDVGIVCAMHMPELAAVLELPWGWTESVQKGDSTTYYIGRVPTESGVISIVAACAPYMGMNASCVLAMKMIQHFQPRYLGIVGIAAGIRSEVSLGDVLIADHTWDYSSGKWKETHPNDGTEETKLAFQPDPRSLTLRSDLRDWFLKLSTDWSKLDAIKRSLQFLTPSATNFRIHVGPIASGPAVISAASVAEDIRTRSRKLIGIDMEAYAVFYSATNAVSPPPSPFCIKGVSDFADSRKADDGNDSSRSLAAKASAAVLKYFLESNACTNKVEEHMAVPGDSSPRQIIDLPRNGS